MKKTLLTLSLLIGLFAAVHAQIVITEIMYNPPESMTDSLEYLEFYNAGSSTVDLAGYTIVGATFTFPSFSLAPGQYVVVSKNSAAIQNQFGVSSLQWDANQALTNGGETIKLLNPAGGVVDSVAYDDAFPWPSGANGSGASIVLCDVSSNNNDPTNWAAATTPTGVTINGFQVYANPGATSNCSTISYPEHYIADVTTVDFGTGIGDSVGIHASLAGIVYGTNLRASSTGLQFTIIDNDNNGIAVFLSAGDAGYANVQEGDLIEIHGLIAQFNGLIQILPDAILGPNSSNNPLVMPEVVVVPDEYTESSLIRIHNLHFIDPTEWTTGTGTGGFTVRALSDAHPQDTVFIRIDNDVDLYNLPIPNSPFDLIGIGGQFDSSNPYTSGYQIQPRYVADFLPVLGTHEANFSRFVKVSPNPASNWIKVQMSKSFDAMRLMGADGKLLMSWQRPESVENISVFGLPAGTYTLRFEKGGQSWSTRFVKQ